MIGVFSSLYIKGRPTRGTGMAWVVEDLGKDLCQGPEITGAGGMEACPGYSNGCPGISNVPRHGRSAEAHDPTSSSTTTALDSVP